jgi:hypothetical protein
VTGLLSLPTELCFLAGAQGEAAAKRIVAELARFASVPVGS